MPPELPEPEPELLPGGAGVRLLETSLAGRRLPVSGRSPVARPKTGTCRGLTSLRGQEGLRCRQEDTHTLPWRVPTREVPQVGRTGSKGPLPCVHGGGLLGGALGSGDLRLVWGSEPVQGIGLGPQWGRKVGEWAVLAGTDLLNQGPNDTPTHVHTFSHMHV